MNATRRRIVATVEQQQGEAPSLDLVRRTLAQRAPAGIEALSIRWSSYFRIHHRQVAKLRVRRMFVAGDAAHIHSPFGGQGMNTGLQDVWNLVWKLDLAIRGWGNERLLESYSAERRPVIKNVLETTHRLTKVMGTPHRFAQAMRDLVIPVLCRIPPFQHAFVQRLSQLAIAYGGSPIVEGDGTRYFDDSLRGGKGIGTRFLLLVPETVNASTKAAINQLSESYSPIVEVRKVQNGRITLIRPDGYAAYEATHLNRASAVTHFRSVLERQTMQERESLLVR